MGHDPDEVGGRQIIVNQVRSFVCLSCRLSETDDLPGSDDLHLSGPIHSRSLSSLRIFRGCLTTSDREVWAAHWGYCSGEHGATHLFMVRILAIKSVDRVALGNGITKSLGKLPLIPQGIGHRQIRKGLLSTTEILSNVVRTCWGSDMVLQIIWICSFWESVSLPMDQSTRFLTLPPSR